MAKELRLVIDVALCLRAWKKVARRQRQKREKAALSAPPPPLAEPQSPPPPLEAPPSSPPPPVAGGAAGAAPFATRTSNLHSLFSQPLATCCRPLSVLGGTPSNEGKSRCALYTLRGASAASISCQRLPPRDGRPSPVKKPNEFKIAVTALSSSVLTLRTPRGVQTAPHQEESGAIFH